MDTNDFLGSFAQENVSFTTRVIRTSMVGDNFWKVMVFIENDRFVDTSGAEWTLVPGSLSIKALTVTANDYSEHTTGVLQSWLYDLFCNGFSGDCILVACAPHDPGTTVLVYSSDGSTFYEDAELSIPAVIPSGKTPVATGVTNQYSYTADPSPAAFIEAMETAYELLKAHAYHKTVCAAPTLAVTAAYTTDTNVAVSLATKCAADKGLLSSVPYLPFTTGTPEDLTSDALYMAIKNSNKDAFFSAHQDTTRNGALYSLGLALATLNGSGTCVGSSLDMAKSTSITCSGAGGLNLDKGIRSILKNAHIQYFKPVGNNTGAVAAEGAESLSGDVMQATWIISYVTYMTKVRVAEMITVPNYIKNSSNYNSILNVMMGNLAKFGPNGSGRLESLNNTAPAFKELPQAEQDVIIVPDAWSAKYVDQVREVQITGALYIGA